MPNKYKNLIANIQDISDNCDWGDYYSKLNLPNGLCYGMAYMWGQAFLANDTKTFYKRLEILTKDYKHISKKLSTIINEQTNIQKKIPLDSKLVSQANYYKEKQSDKDYEQILSIRAFLDGLLLYHFPDNTSLYEDQIDNNLHSQDEYISSKYIVNDRISKKSKYSNYQIPLLEIYNKPFAGKKNDFEKYFRSIYKSLTSLLSQSPFLVVFNSHNHAVALGCTKSTTYFYDLNSLVKNNIIHYPVNSLKSFATELFNAYESLNRHVPK